jgi:hypothetical protein
MQTSLGVGRINGSVMAADGTRPPATLGCAQAEVASGYPNAHLSLRRAPARQSARPALRLKARIGRSRPQPFKWTGSKIKLGLRRAAPAEAPATSTLIFSRTGTRRRRDARSPRRDPAAASRRNQRVDDARRIVRKVSTRGARISCAVVAVRRSAGTAAPSGVEVCASAIPADRLSPTISLAREVMWRARDVSSQPPKRRKSNERMISLRWSRQPIALD